MALTSHHPFPHQPHGMSNARLFAHGCMYSSALPPCRINQVYYYSTTNDILVGYLPDMGMFFHPKSPTTKLQLFQLPPFQLPDSRNIDCLFRRPRQGSGSFMHNVRRSEKLVVLAGSISIGGDEVTRGTTPRYEGREWSQSKLTRTRTSQNRWTEPSIDGR